MGIFALILSIINLVIIFILVVYKMTLVYGEYENKASGVSKDNKETASKKVAQASESEPLFTEKLEELKQSFTKKIEELESKISQNPQGLEKLSQDLTKYTSDVNFQSYVNEILERVMGIIKPYLDKDYSKQSSSPEKHKDSLIIDVPLEKEQDKTAGENEHETGQIDAVKGQFFYFGTPKGDSTFENDNRKDKVDEDCYYKFEIFNDKAIVSLILDDHIKVENYLRHRDTYLAICIFTHEANRTYQSIKLIKPGIFYRDGNIWKMDKSIQIEIS